MKLGSEGGASDEMKWKGDIIFSDMYKISLSPMSPSWTFFQEYNHPSSHISYESFPVFKALLSLHVNERVSSVTSQTYVHVDIKN